MTEARERARKSYDRSAWGDAYEQFRLADTAGPLDLVDVERLATVSFLTGRLSECTEYWARAHRGWLEMGETAHAVRCAFWLGFCLFAYGDFAQGSGWHARARRVLDGSKIDCAEHGFLKVPEAIQFLDSGDFANALPRFAEIAEMGQRFGDRDLTTLGWLGWGNALIRTGHGPEGLALLDEVMLGVTANEVSPLLTGLCYCAVIGVYHEIYDLRRARQWTDALSRLCDVQPDLVPYRGECLAHRAQILQLHGAWPDALDEVQLACERLTDPPGQTSAGPAFYQQAELFRLRGAFARAEEAYRQASQFGYPPQPGLALLRVAQGQVDAAEAAMRRVLDEVQDRFSRSKFLPAYVEIMIAAGDSDSARAGAGELADVAADIDAPLLHAASDTATGAVHLIDGELQTALIALRRAWTTWQALEIPYESARVRTLIGQCCRELGDEDSAQMEFDAALWALRQLGAGPDIARVEALARRRAPRPAGGLTAREVEVLRLVAAGKTNRAIAAELYLSEKTVARHMSNIFAKLGISSRSAATAYAFENELV